MKINCKNKNVCATNSLFEVEGEEHLRQRLNYLKLCAFVPLFIFELKKRGNMKKKLIFFIIICLGLTFFSSPPIIAQEFKSDIIVAHKALNSVGFYNSDGKHLTTIDVGPNPHEMVLSADRKLVYITNNGVMRWMSTEDGGNTVSIVDLTARKKIGEISTGKFRRPHGIDLDTETGLIAVTCEKPDRLLLIDPVKRKVIKDYDPGGVTSHNVTLDRGAKWAYVSNITTNNVGAVNLTTGEVTKIATGKKPQDCVISKDGKELFVACSTYVAVIDIEKKEEIARISNGATRITITPDWQQLVTAVRPSSMEFIDPETHKVIAKVKIPGDPYSISVSKDGKFAFTGAELDNEVYVVSTTEHKLVRNIKTVDGARPDPVLDIPTP